MSVFKKGLLVCALSSVLLACTTPTERVGGGRASSQGHTMSEFIALRPMQGTLLENLVLGQMEARQGDYQTLNETYRVLADQYPQAKDIHLYAINTAIAAGDTTTVRHFVEVLAKRYRKDSRLFSAHQIEQLFTVAVAVEHLESAQVFFDSMQEGKSFDDTVHLLISIDKQLERQFSDGLLAFCQLKINRATADEDMRLFYYVWIEGLIMRSRLARAREVVERGLEVYPQDDHLYYLSAQALFTQSLYAKARTQFEKIDATTDTVYQLLNARIHWKMQEYAQAQRIFTTLYTDQTWGEWALLYSGIMAAEQHQFSVATQHLQKIKNADILWQAQLELAEIARQQNLFDKSLKILSKMRANSAYQRNTQVLLAAQVTQDKGDYKGSINILNALLQADPNLVRAYYQRATVQLLVGNMVHFERDMRTVIELDNNHAEAYNALGYILADKLLRAQEALPLIQKALDLKPNAFHILDSMGWVMYRLQRYDEALHYLEKALMLEFNDEVAAHLAEVLWIMGRKTEAQQLFDAALKRYPQSDILLKIRTLFDNG